jgi:hypothetical protein
MLRFVSIAVLLLGLAPAAHATSGPGCLRIVNVASWDVLNIRSRPAASSRIVDAIDPSDYGIISLRGTCTPRNVAWGSRWCPIAHFYGDRTVRGWVKARFVRDSECP